MDYNYIRQYSVKKIEQQKAAIATSTERFLSDPANAIRFNYHTDIAVYTERLNWYKWLINEDDIDIKSLIINNIGSAMYPKDNTKLLVIRHKLADLFHFSNEMKVDLGEIEAFRSYLTFA